MSATLPLSMSVGLLATRGNFQKTITVLVLMNASEVWNLTENKRNEMKLQRIVSLDP
jgi:hypothetical protein